MSDNYGWDNPIEGGTVLRIPAIQSPNYVHLVSGWAIFQDGTAEFNSITVPPGSGGSTVFVQGTTPTANNVNDIWVNTANANSIYSWNGTTWVQYQFGTGSIQAGAITASLIAAHTITAALIAAGTITTTEIASNTIVAGNIAAATITAAKIASHTITATQIAAGTITATEIASHTITAALIVAGTITTTEIASHTITAANIAAGTITATEIAATTITAANIAANTITAGQIAARTITEATLAAWAVDGVVSQAGFHGLNMIPDPQFSNSTVNTVRTGDAATVGSWTLSGGTAKATNVNGSANILALLSSANKPIWVNPGEQYYVSITVNRGAGTSVNQIGIQLVNQANTAHTLATTLSGTNTLTEVFTIPSGWSQVYVRVFANSSAVADVITWSSPVLQPASLFSPTITGTDWIISASGEFYYSGTPALGNLIASSIPGTAATTDGFGNNVYPGYCLYQANGTATATVVTQIYNGIVSIGLPSGIIGTGGAAPAQFSGGIVNGVANLGSGLTASGDTLASLSLLSKNTSGSPAVALMNLSAAINFLGTGTPVAGSSGVFLYPINGALNSTTQDGFPGTIPVTQSDTSTTTKTTTGFTTFSKTWSIPANDASVGTIYRLTVTGDGTQGSTVEIFNHRLDGTGIGALATRAMAAATIPLSTNFAFKWVAELVITAIGVSGSAQVNTEFTWSEEGVNADTTNSATSVNKDSVSFDTTTAFTMAMQAAWTATTGSPTATSRYSILERLGA